MHDNNEKLRSAIATFDATANALPDKPQAAYAVVEAARLALFFDHNKAEHEINAGYWAEKLDLGRDSVKGFNTDRFVEWCAENAPQVEESDRLVDHEHAAVEVLDEHEVAWDYEDVDSWRDYGHHFIIALYAILWGAKRYHESIDNGGSFGG